MNYKLINSSIFEPIGHWEGAIREEARRLGTRDGKKLPNSPMFKLGFTELGETGDLTAGSWEKPDHMSM